LQALRHEEVVRGTEGNSGEWSGKEGVKNLDTLADDQNEKKRERRDPGKFRRQEVPTINSRKGKNVRLKEENVGRKIQEGKARHEREG